MLFKIFYITFIFSSLILIIKNKSLFSKLNENYNPIQKIHKNFIPPLGGSIIVLSLYFALLFIKPSSILFEINIIFGLLIILTIGLTEDLFGKASAKLRLISITFASIFYCLFLTNFPIIELPLIGELINSNKIIQIIFFTIGLTALTNGSNMIDGVNGLSGFTLLSICLCLLILNINYNLSFSDELILIIIGLIAFLFLNFPFGKIFLGDSGAYSLSWILGVITIEIFSTNLVNTWLAVVILYYPLQEVLFSYLRRLILKKNPMQADIQHTHSIIFFKIKSKFNFKDYMVHLLTTLTLSIFWILPLLYIVFFKTFEYLQNICFLFFLMIIYVCLFLKFKNN